MATNHTEHYQLNLWEPNDSFLRTEFNENSSRIDAALGAHDSELSQHAAAIAEQSKTLTSHTSSLAALAAADVKLATGSYYGTGTTSKTFTFSFKPKVVIATQNTQYLFLLCIFQGQTQFRAAHTSSQDDGTAVWSENSVTLTSSAYGACNQSGQRYFYFALG